ncbi:MAG: hypothetical protein CM1200mP29_07300 [Verrucomicrobiota bacterium]|nr:MAG: hypothetical protein CM1200mP29_07300 [Verrucomicrobiota bacterium]
MTDNRTTLVDEDGDFPGLDRATQSYRVTDQLGRLWAVRRLGSAVQMALPENPKGPENTCWFRVGGKGRRTLRKPSPTASGPADIPASSLA